MRKHVLQACPLLTPEARQIAQAKYAELLRDKDNKAAGGTRVTTSSKASSATQSRLGAFNGFTSGRLQPALQRRAERLQLRMAVAGAVPFRLFDTPQWKEFMTAIAPHIMLHYHVTCFRMQCPYCAICPHAKAGQAGHMYIRLSFCAEVQ